MDLEEVRKLWSERARNEKRSVAAWDAAAASFFENPLPSWDEDPFLIRLGREVPLAHTMRTLDVGCGAGSYSVVIADKVGEAVGCDISPEMIRYAETLAQRDGAVNTNFVCGDFADLDFDERFDVVFAHMMPAMDDLASFERLSALSRGWCYTVTPTRRCDSVFDALLELLDKPARQKDRDTGFLLEFMWVWAAGMEPIVDYHRETWRKKRTLQEAHDWYCGKLLAPYGIDAAGIERADAYLAQAAVDGVVEEVIDTTIATIGWEVGDEEKR